MFHLEPWSTPAVQVTQSVPKCPLGWATVLLVSGDTVQPGTVFETHGRVSVSFRASDASDSPHTRLLPLWICPILAERPPFSSFNNGSRVAVSNRCLEGTIVHVARC